jgi:hypothetical protein
METYKYLDGARLAVRCTASELEEDRTYHESKGFVKVITDIGDGRQSWCWEKREEYFKAEKEK